METKHIKLDYEEALSAKKQLLSMELNLLQTEKRVRNYKLLRKKELAMKNFIRKCLRELRMKINSEKSTMPQEEEPMKIMTIKKGIEKRKQADIQYQLKEIQDKLERLQ
ncbi:MAG: hypothetical protein PHH54_03605 [Candidatus Nanoarchaeia archaeon]|nr:hypothetical protein [Candidatus Nanoarchaeia archaeon]MDD5741044.1 hypothetical protein [Candidatus Nanoarchaeia archaeon]